MLIFTIEMIETLGYEKGDKLRCEVLTREKCNEEEVKYINPFCAPAGGPEQQDASSGAERFLLGAWLSMKMMMLVAFVC